MDRISDVVKGALRFAGGTQLLFILSAVLMLLSFCSEFTVLCLSSYKSRKKFQNFPFQGCQTGIYSIFVFLVF